MMEMYEILYKNIKALCICHRIKISDLETKIGLSVGYLSRMSRKKITVDRIAKAAEILGTTIDDLLHNDFENELGQMIAVNEFRDSYFNLRKFMEKVDILDIVAGLEV